MKRYKRIILLSIIMMFWFTISFITNILGPLIPDIINNFNLHDMTMAGLIPTSFFLAYAIMSIPSGILIDKYGEKLVLSIGWLLPFLGAVFFAANPCYEMLLCSSFIIGIGMAMLQTVLNPLQRAVGGEENYAFIAEIAQFMFGTASFLSPVVYTYLIKHLDPVAYIEGKNTIIDILAQITPPEMPWVSLYWVFATILLLMIIIVLLVRFPKIELSEDERAGSKSTYMDLFHKPFVWMFFFGIFSYVSMEQGISIYMSTFLEQYHNIDPQTTGATCVSWFWGSMTIGCIIGMLLLRLFDSQLLLKYSAITAMALLTLALFFPAPIAKIAFPAIGFSIAMMFSINFSLALNTISTHHGSFAGILCSAIVGGAVGPLLIGILSDLISLRAGMMLIYVFMAYMIFISIKAQPLVKNKTVL